MMMNVRIYFFFSYVFVCWSWKSIDFLLNIESASLERSLCKVFLVLAVDNLELVELLLGLA